MNSPGLLQESRPRLHPLPIRFMHWIKAIALLLLILSGGGIYNDYVIVCSLHFLLW